MSLTLRNLVWERDASVLYEYWASPHTQQLFTGRNSFNTRPEFERWLVRKLDGEFYDFLIAADATSDDALGFAYSYDFRPFDGHCKLTCCVFDADSRLGAGALIGLLMADHLFRCYPLRKIYTEVYSYNERSMRIHRKASHGWKEVAVFEDYRYLSGDYHDLHVFCMERDVFYQRYSKLVTWLRGKGGAPSAMRCLNAHR